MNNNSKSLKESYQYKQNIIFENPDASKKIALKKAFKTNSEILSVRFDSDDSQLAAGITLQSLFTCNQFRYVFGLGNINGSLQVFHLHSSTQTLNINVSNEKSPTPCTCIRWRPPNSSATQKNVITTGDGLGNIVQWHVASGKEIERIQEVGNQILCMDFNNTGQLLATGGKDSTIRVYDEASKLIEYQLSGQGYSSNSSHQNRVFSLKFLPESSHVLISGSWDQNINIWDLRQKKCVGGFIGGKISGDSLDYKNGQILVGANSARDQLKLFDFKERKLIQNISYDPTIRENGAFIFSAQFSKINDESISVGSSGKNEVKIFDKRNSFSSIGSISCFPKGIYSLDYGNQSGKIGFGGGDGLLVVAVQVPK